MHYQLLLLWLGFSVLIVLRHSLLFLGVQMNLNHEGNNLISEDALNKPQVGFIFLE